MDRFTLPAATKGLVLYRIANEELIGCESVLFDGGRPVVAMVLNRAAISGRVEVGGEVADHFADVLDADQNIIETVALDRRSYGALKNRWMRCRVVRHG